MPYMKREAMSACHTPPSEKNHCIRKTPVTGRTPSRYLMRRRCRGVPRTAEKKPPQKRR